MWAENKMQVPNWQPEYRGRARGASLPSAQTARDIAVNTREAKAERAARIRGLKARLDRIMRRIAASGGRHGKR